MQKILGDDLFSATPQVDSIKQILQFFEAHAQPLSVAQLRAIAYLNYLGMRDLHMEYREQNKGQHPYSGLIRWIIESAVSHSDPGVYIRVIEALIPTPQTIVHAQSNNESKKRGRK
ncbi:hypothetical protein SAMN04489725_11618 [Alicyclobacillus hesperidum]|uniref:Uncharacterized protein n=1 Tax=Alicyclobacillus hesperidum TaxID=89784 RepID=A0A1H2WPW1_9BACL|nr:hypothetical protein SAMN04489725_11618 [Alicyclobacillus hesperidum]